MKPHLLIKRKRRFGKNLTHRSTLSFGQLACMNFKYLRSSITLRSKESRIRLKNYAKTNAKLNKIVKLNQILKKIFNYYKNDVHFCRERRPHKWRTKSVWKISWLLSFHAYLRPKVRLDNRFAVWLSFNIACCQGWSTRRKMQYIHLTFSSSSTSIKYQTTTLSKSSFI